jgi:hypothetical protein
MIVRKYHLIGKLFTRTGEFMVTALFSFERLAKFIQANLCIFKIKLGPWPIKTGFNYLQLKY